jgi:predicted RNase H-like HicB family nuclease
VRKKKASSKRLDRPFAPSILHRGQRIVDQYQIILEPDEELGYVGHSLELRHVYADGRTPNACVRATREALTAAVATLLERGERPPEPSKALRSRTAQVNIRLSSSEKRMLEEVARQQGYRSLSDYVRAAALRKAG